MMRTLASITGVAALLAALSPAAAQQPAPMRPPVPTADAGVPRATADAGTAATSPDAGALPAPVADAGTAGPSADAGPTIIQPPPHATSTVTVAPSAPEVTVGRRFSVFITVDPGRKARLDPALNFGGAFDIGRRDYKDRTLPSGVTVREIEVEMIAWVVGDVNIPPFKVNYVVDGTAYSAVSKPTPLKVISFIGDAKEELRDVAPPVTVKRRDWLIVYLLISVLAAGIVGLIGVFVVRKLRKRTPRPRRRKPGKVASPATLRADHEALARLDGLAESGALDEDDRKPAYLELSEIVRNYLSRRYGFQALDLTTSEIKQRMNLHPEAAPFADELNAWMKDGDMVRYANYKPSRPESEQSIAAAREFVLKTWGAPKLVREVVPPQPEPAQPPTPGPGPGPTPAPTAAMNDTIPDRPRDPEPPPPDPSEQWSHPVPEPLPEAELELSPGDTLPGTGGATLVDDSPDSPDTPKGPADA